MDSNQLNELFDDWSDVYKKGKLTFWILLSLYDGKKYAAEIHHFIDQRTNGVFNVREQSLYRALRRYSDMGLVEISKEESTEGGPPRNYFQLNQYGVQLLKRFIQEQLQPLTNDRTRHLLELITVEEI